jgi:phospholipase/lecithinase/hemolysin
MLFNIASLVAVALAAASVVDAKPVSSSQCHFNNILVFGDSYSDNGNVYELTNHTWPLKFNDHGRFTNGPVWSEHV